MSNGKITGKESPEKRRKHGGEWIRGDGNYGFYSAGDLPEGEYTQRVIAHADTVSWVAMRDFEDRAHNHCGATEITNLMLFFAHCGYPELLVNRSAADTFDVVHHMVGNGPVAAIAESVRRYAAQRGYTIEYRNADHLEDVRRSVEEDRPCGILLIDGLFSWHWVLCVGYREYENGEFYLRVHDNWSRSADRYYKTGKGSVWWSATSYRIMENRE